MENSLIINDDIKEIWQNVKFDIEEFKYDSTKLKDLIAGYCGSCLGATYAADLDKEYKEYTLNYYRIYTLLTRILNWYKDNLHKIQSNEFVYHPEEHLEFKNKIENLLNPIENFILPKGMNNREKNQYFFELNELLSEDYKEEFMEQSDLKSPSFFISHNQLDSNQAQKIVGFLKSLGISKERIFCSSVDSTGIPGDADINDYIKTQLNDNCFFIFLLSNNYFNSLYCLNEMGAAWINIEESKQLVFSLDDSVVKFINRTVLKSTKKRLNMDRKGFTSLKSVLVKNEIVDELSSSDFEEKLETINIS